MALARKLGFGRMAEDESLRRFSGPLRLQVLWEWAI
jgi:hypothetical protein